VQTLRTMHHHKAGIIGRILRYNLLLDANFQFLRFSRDEKTHMELVEKVCSEYYYEQQGLFIASREEKPGVSKEHIIVEKTLRKLIKDPEDLKVEVSVDGLFSNDFLIPSKKTVVEINGDLHFYPYTSKFSNVFQLKQNILKREGFNIINLNIGILKGLSRSPEKLEDLLNRQLRKIHFRKKALT